MKHQFHSGSFPLHRSFPFFSLPSTVLAALQNVGFPGFQICPHVHVSLSHPSWTFSPYQLICSAKEELEPGPQLSQLALPLCRTAKPFPPLLRKLFDPRSVHLFSQQMFLSSYRIPFSQLPSVMPLQADAHSGYFSR